MASFVTSENWACVEDFEGNDQVLSDIDCAFLVSALMDDRVEESDEERLNSVIQSLEAEINYSSTTDHVVDDHLDASQMDGHDCSISFHDLEMMNVWFEMAESEPSNNELNNNWYMYPSGEMISIKVNDYSSNDTSTNCLGVALDDQDQYAYSSLWQDTTYGSNLMCN